MRSWLRATILRRLLAKPLPERYSISAATKDQKHYDWISIRGKTEAHEDVTLRSLDSSTGVVEYFWWPSEPSNAKSTIDQCHLDEVNWDSLVASHRYITWQITYNSLWEAYIHDFLRLPRIKWFVQSIRDKFIRPVRPNYQIRLLARIVDIFNDNKPIEFSELLVSIYGPAVRMSDDKYIYERQLRFLIDSLVESGNAAKPDENNQAHYFDHGCIIPTPKSISTLAAHDLEMRKLRQSTWLACCQLLLGLGMLAIAAATFYLKLTGG